jgi:hypothetical protein
MLITEESQQMTAKKQMYHLTDVFRDEQHRKDWQFMSRDESDDEALIRRVVRDARETQLKYRACGQTCLYPLSLHLGLGSREAIVAMTTLTGGFGGREICCALVGGIAAIGLEFGRVDFTEMGAPRSRGQGTFTMAQARAAELRERFAERTGDLLRCCDLCDRHFSKGFAPPDRKDPVAEERIKSGEQFSMWSTYAAELVALSAEIACEIILRSRRQRGIITPLMAFPWYNRTWELQQLTESLKPESES